MGWKEATVKRYHYASHAELREHLKAFLTAYNYAKRLKTLRGLTPYEFICQEWARAPALFLRDPVHHTPGPYTLEGVREGLLANRKMLQDCYGQRMVVEGLGVEIDSADEALLKQLLEVMESRAGDSTFGVGELAEELGLSPRHLRRRIREATGESPAGLLRRFRLEVAGRLLAAGAASVSEAGYRVGYASPAAFGTQFKKHFGASPSDYAAAPPEADGP